MAMDAEYESRLRKEVQQSGFPLELEVVEKLRAKKYLVSPNLSYSGAEGAIHEIDVLALSRSNRLKNWPFGWIGLILLIECKRSRDKPWVFFEEIPDPLTWLGLVGRVSYLTDLHTTDPHNILAGCMNTELVGHHFNSQLPTARTYFEAFKGHNAGSDIFKAITSIWYAADFTRRWFNGPSDQNQLNGKRTALVQGVIVLDGELIVTRKIRENYDVAPIDHLLLRTVDCLTRVGSSPFPSDNEVLIDVIRKDYLDTYLKVCTRDRNLFQKHVQKIFKAGWINESS